MSAKACSRSDGERVDGELVDLQPGDLLGVDGHVEVGALGGDVGVGGGLVAPLVGDGGPATGRRGAGQGARLAQPHPRGPDREHRGVVGVSRRDGVEAGLRDVGRGGRLPGLLDRGDRLEARVARRRGRGLGRAQRLELRVGGPERVPALAQVERRDGGSVPLS